MTVSTDDDNCSPLFAQVTLSGDDALSFLQGQVTLDMHKHIQPVYQATAICNLKGRIHFGLWVKQHPSGGIDIVTSQDCMDELIAHIKKYAAFSKVVLSEPTVTYPYVEDTTEPFSTPSFTQVAASRDVDGWQAASIAQGNYWITAATQNIFQPQALRLHQRGGIDYDKGCYLGQEVVARLYFKAAPKAYLHRVSGVGAFPKAGSHIDKVEVVNSISTSNGFEALVVARPEQLLEHELTILSLPPALNASMERQ